MADFSLFTLLGLIQGVTEFLPISSTGHLILVREWLGSTDSFGLAEDAVLHLATALAVLVYFKKDITALVLGSFSAVKGWKINRELKLAIALIIATIPAVAVGLSLEGYIESSLRGSVIVAIGLIVGSGVFLLAEYIGKKITEKKDITLRKSVALGVFQAFALLPGMSRSGMLISGGLLLGLSRYEAARFGFLLAFPIILGAGVLKLYELFETGALITLGAPLLWGAIIAFLSGIAAIHTLLGFVRTHSLMPFVFYRLALASVILLIVFI